MPKSSGEYSFEFVKAEFPADALPTNLGRLNITTNEAEQLQGLIHYHHGRWQGGKGVPRAYLIVDIQGATNRFGSPSQWQFRLAFTLGEGTLERTPWRSSCERSELATSTVHLEERTLVSSTVHLVRNPKDFVWERSDLGEDRDVTLCGWTPQNKEIRCQVITSTLSGVHPSSAKLEEEAKKLAKDLGGWLGTTHPTIWRDATTLWCLAEAYTLKTQIDRSWTPGVAKMLAAEQKTGISVPSKLLPSLLWSTCSLIPIKISGSG